LWTNACCTHPRPSEQTAEAAHRRLYEEMGLQCSLDYQFPFLYKAVLDKGLTEHEYDHVFFGTTDKKPVINNEEVSDWRYVAMPELSVLIKEKPLLFTEWFKIIFDRVKELRS
jgi:isopentenyl-diphosphate delta-isomerase